MEFEKACSEVDFILKHLNIEERKKIPKKVLDFFKLNKDLFYEVKLDTNIPLEDQNLKEETKAFLQIIKDNYFKEEE